MLRNRCDRFSRLLSERADRDLTPAEARFFDRHMAECPGCAREAGISGLSLDILRTLRVEETESSGFEDRVVSVWKQTRLRRDLGYWSPALVGAAVSAIALVAVLNATARTPKSGYQAPATSEARRLTIDQRFPELGPIPLSNRPR